MDMLYRAYSNPLNLMSIYINQGRFGTFVEGFLREEAERNKRENERNNDMKLWIAYVHSMSSESFGTWKDRVYKPNAATKHGGDESLDDAGIQSIIDGLFNNPSNGGEK